MIVTEDEITQAIDTIQLACNTTVSINRDTAKNIWKVHAGWRGVGEGLTIGIAIQNLKDKISQDLEQEWLQTLEKQTTAKQRLDLIQHG